MRGDALLASHEEAQRVWSGVGLDAERYGRHLESLGWTDDLPPHTSDVYLACACACADEAACRHFEASFVGQISANAGHICPEVALKDEVVQRVRHKLLVGPPPGLLKYTGRGPLLAWLRSVTRRAALDARREQKQLAEEPSREARPEPVSSIESRIDRGRFLQEFEQSLAKAFAALPSRDRNLLRMHYASGVGIDALGRAYNVHRATAARWLARIRQDIFAAVRAEMTGDGAGLSASEFDDVVRLVRDGLDLSLRDWDAASRASVLGLCADADADASSHG